MEKEARSCSMDFEFIAREYVCRMWGGSVAIENLAFEMEEVKGKMKEHL